MPVSSAPTRTAALYSLAEAHGHTVNCFPIHRRGLSIEDAGRCYIALRPSLTEIEEKETLAHELGHCEFGGFYSRHTKIDTVERHERRADKWAFYKLLPPAWVRGCVKRGICEVYRIADEAGVSCEFALKALSYYHQLGII